ncbi:hypothetical protein GCM10025880_58980 [Methylorubrum aminovorans]|nr:hypothetical protein GCM10025880_58980 [Methylorubrum aminovorans]
MQRVGLNGIDHGALVLAAAPGRDQEQQAENRTTERRSQKRKAHQALGRKIREAAQALAGGKPIEHLAQELAGAAHGRNGEASDTTCDGCEQHESHFASPHPGPQPRRRLNQGSRGRGDVDGLIALAGIGSRVEAMAPMHWRSNTRGSPVRTVARGIQGA